MIFRGLEEKDSENYITVQIETNEAFVCMALWHCQYVVCLCTIYSIGGGFDFFERISVYWSKDIHELS